MSRVPATLEELLADEEQRKKAIEWASAGGVTQGAEERAPYAWQTTGVKSPPGVDLEHQSAPITTQDRVRSFLGAIGRVPEETLNRAGQGFDASTQQFLAAIGVPHVDQVRDLSPATRPKATTGKPPAMTDAQAQAVVRERYPDATEVLVNNTTAGNFEEVMKDLRNKAGINERSGMMTRREELEKSRLTQMAEQGKLNRSVQWARLRQEAEDNGASRDLRRWLFEQEEDAKERERADKRADKESEETDKAAQDYGKEAFKSGIPSAVAKIGEIKTLFAKYPGDLPGIGFVAGMVPSRFEEEDAKRLRMLVGQLGADYQKQMTGAGASDAERTRYDEVTGLLKRGDSESLRLGVQMMEDDLNVKASSLEAAYRPDAVRRVKQRTGGAAPKRVPVTDALPAGPDGKPTLDVPDDTVRVILNGTPKRVPRKNLDALKKLAAEKKYTLEVPGG